MSYRSNFTRPMFGRASLSYEPAIFLIYPNTIAKKRGFINRKNRPQKTPFYDIAGQNFA